MLAPISWPLPPSGYGPWELVAYNLVEALVRRGHDVTVFAARGSRVSGRLVETCPHALAVWPEAERNRVRELDPQSGLLEGPPDARALEQLHIAQCMEQAAAGSFDIVHSHLHIHALMFARLIPCPLVTTLHGAAWVRSAHPALRAFQEMPFVSLSDAERGFLPELNYVATVYNGICIEDFPFEGTKDDYLLFAGRLSPEKGAAEAVQIAKRTGRRLLLAGMIEPQYQSYFDAHLEPHLDDKQIAYLGLLSQADLAPVYRKAAAVLFPIKWAEPFGLVAVEAQASGTPLIANRCGALPEIIKDNETGFVVDSIDEAVAAVDRLESISPMACRLNAETRFTVAHMGQGYERVYMRLAR
jgi:glycosyltransferase involved in cell wall biosynthesis